MTRAAVGDLYSWFKALHIIMVIAWMAGLFYLPRLFVYHATAPAGGDVSEQFKIMERRLARAIMLPAAAGSWVFGLLLALAGGFLPQVPAWLAVKLGLVIALSVYHGVLHRHVGEFAADLRLHGDRYFRILNEVPTVIVIAVVFIVVFKPSL
jgi:putative membrane protein